MSSVAFRNHELNLNQPTSEGLTVQRVDQVTRELAWHLNLTRRALHLNTRDVLWKETSELCEELFKAVHVAHITSTDVHQQTVKA